LSDTERQVYQDKANADKVRYKRELKEFEKEVDKLGLEQNLKKGERKPRKPKKQAATKPGSATAGSKRKNANQPTI